MANLTRGKTKEIALQHLLVSNCVDVAFLTETDIPAHLIDAYILPHYTTYYFGSALTPTGIPKIRIIALVREDVARLFSLKERRDLVQDERGLSVWLELTTPRGKIILGGTYRQWTNCQDKDLASICDQLRAAATASKFVVAMGDYNLDPTRLGDQVYKHKGLTRLLMDTVRSCGYTHHSTCPTFRSHGTRARYGNRTSTLDHCHHPRGQDLWPGQSQNYPQA